MFKAYIKGNDIQYKNQQDQHACSAVSQRPYQFDGLMLGGKHV